MYRRRRPEREKITFGFDSFLDVVANVIGIIIRLILVAWVGARTYHASMQFVDEPSESGPLASLPAPKAEDDPLHGKLTRLQAELNEARDRLLAKLRDLELAEARSLNAEKEMQALAVRSRDLDVGRQALENELSVRGKRMELASLSMEEIRKRGLDLMDQIKRLENTPLDKKVLRYHTPVSRDVQGDEIFFECREGRVTYIDLPAFLQEVRAGMEDMGEKLRSDPKVVSHTGAVGAFRLRYTFERERGLLDSPGGNFRYGMTEWVVESLSPQRGEALQAALAAGSDFRRVADAIDTNQGVVTFWVYPDSFEVFRALRDYLYDRDIQVAGRPLPIGAPIAASRSGTKSRGQ